EVGVRGIQHLAPAGDGGIHPLESPQRAIGHAERAERVALVALERVHDALRLLAQRAGLAEPAGLGLERLVLARRDPGLLDLVDHVPEVVGAAADLVAAVRERSLL